MTYELSQIDNCDTQVGAVAQLGARLHGMQKVRGSNPRGSIKREGRHSNGCLPFLLEFTEKFRMGFGSQRHNLLFGLRVFQQKKRRATLGRCRIFPNAGGEGVKGAPELEFVADSESKLPFSTLAVAIQYHKINFPVAIVHFGLK